MTSKVISDPAPRSFWPPSPSVERSEPHWPSRCSSNVPEGVFSPQDGCPCCSLSQECSFCNLTSYPFIFFFFCDLVLKNFFFVGGKLLYNVMLVSAIRQHKSVTIIRIYPLPPEPPPTLPLSVITEHQVGLLGLFSNSPLSSLHTIVYTCQCYFLNLSNPHHSPLGPQVHFLLGSSGPLF